MSRDVQHIVEKTRADRAAIEGKKVKALCGKRVYQMPNMKDEIPTCTPCTRIMREEHNDLVAMWNRETTRIGTYTFTFWSNFKSGDR